MICSFTFLELGQAAVSDGSGWLTPVCVRTNMIDQVAGCMLQSLAPDERHCRQFLFVIVAAQPRAD